MQNIFYIKIVTRVLEILATVLALGLELSVIFLLLVKVQVTVQNKKEMETTLLALVHANTVPAINKLRVASVSLVGVGPFAVRI